MIVHIWLGTFPRTGWVGGLGVTGLVGAGQQPGPGTTCLGHRDSRCEAVGGSSGSCLCSGPDLPGVAGRACSGQAGVVSWTSLPHKCVLGFFTVCPLSCFTSGLLENLTAAPRGIWTGFPTSLDVRKSSRGAAWVQSEPPNRPERVLGWRSGRESGVRGSSAPNWMPQVCQAPCSRKYFSSDSVLKCFGTIGVTLDIVRSLGKVPE